MTQQNKELQMHEARAAAVTQPLIPGVNTPEELIVYEARVSSPNQRTENAERLLSYCARNGHWSVFAQADFTVEIVTSRAIMAQVLRHYSFEFQERSMRYQAIDAAVDWGDVEIRCKHKDGNRQGSSELMNDATMAAIESCEDAELLYSQLMSAGAAPESARMVMPLATPTRAYMKGSARSWMTYFWQRLDSHAQKEHRELAWNIFYEFEKHFPIIANMVLTHKSRVVEGDWISRPDK